MCPLSFDSQFKRYRISANNFRGNYSFLEVGVRKLLKGGNYSGEETIVFFTFCIQNKFLPMNNSRKYHYEKLQFQNGALSGVPFPSCIPNFA